MLPTINLFLINFVLTNDDTLVHCLSSATTNYSFSLKKYAKNDLLQEFKLSPPESSEPRSDHAALIWVDLI
jgi:hypothetical protein